MIHAPLATEPGQAIYARIPGPGRGKGLPVVVPGGPSRVGGAAAPYRSGAADRYGSTYVPHLMATQARVPPLFTGSQVL
ncbi:hypothetical protein GCM10018791_18490 [Streptomyces zaomyceticus]|nr:hypothetical protein GCM10018791_18490 [Streptomyces zaomyceticus]